MTKLPLITAEIERVAGREAAIKLSRERGGQTIYTPYEAREGHWLAELVGLEAARKICEHYRVGDAGTYILIPIAKQAMQRQLMAEALEAGSTASQAAAASGMHERTAYRTRRRLRNKDQGELF